jgi:hypothetical protein
MEHQSAREPLLDVEKLEPVENVEVEDGLDAQNGRSLRGVFHGNAFQIQYCNSSALMLARPRRTGRKHYSGVSRDTFASPWPSIGPLYVSLTFVRFVSL